MNSILGQRSLSTSLSLHRKKVIEPGVYRSGEQAVYVDAPRLKHWENQFKKMKDMGISVPVPWGHLTDAIPKDNPEMDEFVRSKFNAGFMEDLKVEGDALYCYLDIPDPEDSRRIGSTVREVSPEIQSLFVDGKGRKWQDVISHMALVVLPVVPGQENFEDISFTLEPDPEDWVDSLQNSRFSLAYHPRGVDRIRLSLRSREMPKTNVVKYNKKQRMDLDGPDNEMVPTGDDPVGDLLAKIRDVGDIVEKLSGGPDDGGEVEMATDDYGLEGDEMLEDEFGDDELEEGDELEDEFDDDELGGDEELLGDELEDDEDEEIMRETPQQIVMSLQNQLQKSGNELQELRQENKAIKNQLAIHTRKQVEGHRLSLQSRIRTAYDEGRCTKEQRERLESGLGATRLSLKSVGSSPIEGQLEMIEMNEEGTYYSEEVKTARMSLARQENPNPTEKKRRSLFVAQAVTSGMKQEAAEATADRLGLQN